MSVPTTTAVPGITEKMQTHSTPVLLTISAETAIKKLQKNSTVVPTTTVEMALTLEMRKRSASVPATISAPDTTSKLKVRKHICTNNHIGSRKKREAARK